MDIQVKIIYENIYIYKNIYIFYIKDIYYCIYLFFGLPIGWKDENRNLYLKNINPFTSFKDNKVLSSSNLIED